MFNEAFYLYQLIKKAFTAPSITPLIVLAYGVPFLMTGSYILARLFIHSATPASTLMMMQTQQPPTSLSSPPAPVSLLSSNPLTITANEDISATSILHDTLHALSNMTTLSSMRLTTSTASPITINVHPVTLTPTASSSSLTSNTNAAAVTAAAVKSTMDDDPCWMLPAKDSWKEWIINGPNLCMLMVSFLEKRHFLQIES
jgi:hypothetical protein